MFLYTNKDLVDVLPLRKKSFVECGINTNSLEVIAIKEGTFAFLEVEDLEKYNNSKIEDLTVQTLEEREDLISKLKLIQQQEREEARKNTNEYKISVLEKENATLKEGLKAVLSGDMQSLAYILYPEDFTDINENSTTLEIH